MISTLGWTASTLAMYLNTRNLWKIPQKHKRTSTNALCYNYICFHNHIKKWIWNTTLDDYHHFVDPVLPDESTVIQLCIMENTTLNIVERNGSDVKSIVRVSPKYKFIDTRNDLIFGVLALVLAIAVTFICCVTVATKCSKGQRNQQSSIRSHRMSSAKEFHSKP